MQSASAVKSPIPEGCSERISCSSECPYLPLPFLRYVQFVFVAGQRTELQLEPRRKWLDCYGPEGGLDWKPYMPEISHEVAILAQTVASAENLRYEVVPLDVGLQFSDCLKVAEQSNKLVVIIVDTWTLLVKRYYTLMREYDSQNFLNCILVIPWNTKDDETVCNRELWKKWSWQHFVPKLIRKIRILFWI